VWIYP